MEHTQEEEDNFTEISNVTMGDLLSENPEVAVSAFGPHRYSKQCRSVTFMYTQLCSTFVQIRALFGKL